MTALATAAASFAAEHDAFALLLGGSAWLVAGALIGAFHFLTLRTSARMLTGESSLLAALALHLARFPITAGALALIASHGALPLLAATIGVLAARTAVVRVVSWQPEIRPAVVEAQALAGCRSWLLLPPLRGEKGGMRGARRESVICSVPPQSDEATLAKGRLTSASLPLPHAPLTPSLSPRWGERESCAMPPNPAFPPAGTGAVMTGGEAPQNDPHYPSSGAER